MRVLVMDRTAVGGAPVFGGIPVSAVDVTPAGTWSTVTPAAVANQASAPGGDFIWRFTTTIGERVEIGVWNAAADAPADGSGTNPDPARTHLVKADAHYDLRIPANGVVKVRTTTL